MLLLKRWLTEAGKYIEHSCPFPGTGVLKNID
jgi:hypothetical protein